MTHALNKYRKVNSELQHAHYEEQNLCNMCVFLVFIYLFLQTWLAENVMKLILTLGPWLRPGR